MKVLKKYLAVIMTIVSVLSLSTVSFAKTNTTDIVESVVVDEQENVMDVTTETLVLNKSECTHIPCNQTIETLYKHDCYASNPSVCYVSTAEFYKCKCCNQYISQKTDWVYSYSHPSHF